MSAELKKFLAINLPEFLLLVTEPQVVFAAGNAVRSLQSVVVCYDAQHFYKNLVKNGKDLIAAGKESSVHLNEFVEYCESKIPSRFADDADHYRCPMTVSDLMRVDAWARLYANVGARLMRILLFECMLFVPLPGGAYYCVNAPATAASHQMIRSLQTLAWSRKPGNGGGKTNGRPLSRPCCFNIAGLLKNVKPLKRMADADKMFLEIPKDENDRDDETHLDGLKRKLRVIATKHSLPALRSIFADTVGDHGDSAEVPLGRVKRFAVEVVRKMVPRELFGQPGNRDQYCRNLCRVLDGGKRHDYTIQHLTHKITVKRVGWLRTVVPADRRPAVMARTLVWLTNTFVFRRIVHFFRIVSTDKPSNGIAYFVKSGWAAACREKLSPLASHGGWFCQQREAGVKDRHWKVCPYAKPGGRVRLIFKQLLPDKRNEKWLTDQCLSFLRCLLRGAYSPECRSVSRKQFFRMWQKQHLGEDGRGSSGVLYYVRTDFRDAFTSFEQDKLLKVVQDRIVERFEKKMQWLRAHTVDVIRVGKKNSRVFRKKCTFYDGLPAPEFPADSLVFHDRSDSVTLSRIWSAVRHRVLCNVVDRGGRLWAMTRGVVQGDRLSVALCDLLLADLQATRLASFCTAAGRLYRFVDDYVFVSPVRSEARRFLSTMMAGFDEYGLRLNRSKTVTNALDGRGTGCTFLGFRLDAATGSVTRDEGAYRGRRPLHFFDYGLGCRPGQALYAKMTRPVQHPIPAALINGALNPTGTAARNLASVAAYKAFTLAAAVRHYYFHLNPDHVLRTVHAIARLMYRKLCAHIGRAAITPMQCKWIVYEVYARVLGSRLSGGDARVTWIVHQLRDRQAAVARRCETGDLKAALRRGGGYDYAKIFD